MFSVFWLPITKGGLSDCILTFYFTATQQSCALCLGLPWNVFNGTASLLPVQVSAAWAGWHMKKG